MIKKTILAFAMCHVLNLAAAPPKYEIRAAWLTTAFRLDWPATVAKDTLSAAKQRTELVKILEHLHFLNFNTVFLQVRLRNDAIYASKTEPWSAMLSGKAGHSPGYDALEFAVEECHKRRLECHAWIVTIPIGSDKQVRANGAQSLTKTHPSMCKRIKGEWFLNPALPETATYLAQIASEITRNYDIDGIHLDYLRYPEIGEFPDQNDFQKNAFGEKKSDWRRANINRIEAAIYDSVKNLKPWVQVSASPIGKRDDLDTLSSHGWNGRSIVFQDVKQWLSDQKIDFTAPMLYFKEPVFCPFLSDWKQTSGSKPVAAGIALYMLNEKRWSIDIIKNELDYTRTIGCGGQTFFRTENLIRNTKGCADLLKQDFYTYPALLPPGHQSDSFAPLKPAIETVYQQGNSLIFKWKNTESNNNLRYNLYADTCKNIDTHNVKNLIACRIKSNQFELEIPDDFVGDIYFCITATDRFHNESEPSAAALVRFDKQFLQKKLNSSKN